jgi:hypothetical protein
MQYMHSRSHDMRYRPLLLQPACQLFRLRIICSQPKFKPSKQLILKGFLQNKNGTLFTCHLRGIIKLFTLQQLPHQHVALETNLVLEVVAQTYTQGARLQWVNQAPIYALPATATCPILTRAGATPVFDVIGLAVKQVEDAG